MVVDPRITELLPDVRQRLERLAPLSDEAFQDFVSLLRYEQLEQGGFFARAGEPAEHLAFVASGILREYFLTRGGREFNKAFVQPGSFTGSLFDLMSQAPSTVFIEALTPATLLSASFEGFKELYDAHRDWERLGRRNAELLFVKKARREYEFLTMDAAERYAQFLSTYPGLEERISQYHIASFLGITPVALSRLRKKG